MSYGSITGGIASGLTSLLNSLMNNTLGYMMSSKADSKAAKKQFKYQAALQLQQQNFIKEMASTAHQTEVADLKAAGLNPILSAGGSGAAVVGGGLGSVQVPQTFRPSDVPDVASSALSAIQTLKSLDLADSQMSLQFSQEVKEMAQAQQARAQSDLFRAQAAEIRSGLPLNRIPGSALQTVKDAIPSLQPWIDDIYRRFYTRPEASGSRSRGSQKRPAPPPSSAKAVKEAHQEYRRQNYKTFEQPQYSPFGDDRPKWDPVTGTYTRF